ncbi:MAG: LamG domain-containing protein [Solirubrobacterales bacterium]
MALDGRSGYVSVPHEPSLNVGDAFTLEAWVRRGRTGVSQGLLNKGSRSYQLYFDAGDRLILRMAGVDEITRSTVTLTDRSAFHHVAVAKSGSSVRLYIDGVDRTGPVANRTLQNTTGNLLIGAGSGFFTGTLDEVAVYDRALAAAAVARHHSAGRG